MPREGIGERVGGRGGAQPDPGVGGPQGPRGGLDEGAPRARSAAVQAEGRGSLPAGPGPPSPRAVDAGPAAAWAWAPCAAPPTGPAGRPAQKSPRAGAPGCGCGGLERARAKSGRRPTAGPAGRRAPSKDPERRSAADRRPRGEELACRGPGTVSWRRCGFARSSRRSPRRGSRPPLPLRPRRWNSRAKPPRRRGRAPWRGGRLRRGGANRASIHRRPPGPEQRRPDRAGRPRAPPQSRIQTVNICAQSVFSRLPRLCRPARRAHPALLRPAAVLPRAGRPLRRRRPLQRRPAACFAAPRWISPGAGGQPSVLT